MIYNHNEQTINQYFENPAMNQSALKVLIDSGIQEFLVQQQNLVSTEEPYYSEKEHFVIGSAIDCLLTQGEDAFKEKYYTSELIDKPSDNIMSIIQMVFDNIIIDNAISIIDEGEEQREMFNLTDYPREVYEACNSHAYYMNRKKEDYKEDTRINSILKGGLAQRYFDDLIASNGKQLLSISEKQTCTNIVNSFKNHPHTRRFFNDTLYTDIIYQMPIYFTFEGVPCKILPDLIVVNHTSKRIYPLDIKTTRYPVLLFNKAIKERRYDIQGAFYTDGIKCSLNKISNLISRDIANYTVADFAFIVESTKYSGTPMVFILDVEALNTGRIGDGRYKQGYVQAIQKLKDWQGYNFSLEERFANTNGIVWVGTSDFTYSENF